MSPSNPSLYLLTTPVFSVWILGDWVQVLRLGKQALYWLGHLPFLLIDFKLDALGHVLMAAKSGHFLISLLARMQLVTELPMLYVCNRLIEEGSVIEIIVKNSFLELYHGVGSAIKSTYCSRRGLGLVPSTYISQLSTIYNKLQKVWHPLLASLCTCSQVVHTNSCRCMHIHTITTLQIF